MNQSLGFYCGLRRLVFPLVLILCFCPKALAHDQKTLGWIERIRIEPHNFVLKAKLDTGADLSSINASDVSFFKRKNERWVRFALRDDNGKYHQIQRRVLRSIKIKRFSGMHRERPVIRLRICIDDLLREVEFTLEDRSLFAYPVLIGRRLLSGNVLVDASSMLTSAPSCPANSTMLKAKSQTKNKKAGTRNE